MALPTVKNNKKPYLSGVVFLVVILLISPNYVVAQTGTSLPQNFASTIFCVVNNLLGIKSCGQETIPPSSDLVAGVSFVPVDDKPPPQIIQQITQPVIERTVHTKEIIQQVEPENSSNGKVTEATLAHFGSQLDELSRTLYQSPASVYDDTALWRVIAQMNVGGVSSGASSDDQSLAFDSGTSILTISGGNSIDLSALSGSAGSDDQTLSAATYNASTKELSISIENGNTVTIDLSDLIDDADASVTNEIQSLSLSGDSLSLSGTSTAIDLSTYLDDTTLTELQVDAFVSNNGYLTSEVDSSVSNEIQDLQLSGNNLTITGNGSATTIDLSPYLDNTDTLSDLTCSSNEITKWNGSAWVCSSDASGAGGTDDQTIDSFTLSANIISLSLEGDGEPVKTIDLTAYVNTDTQLNETQVDSFVANNGYLTVETDDQTIDAFGLFGNTLSLSLEADGEAAKTVDLSTYAKDADLHDAITLSGAFDYLSLVGQDIVRGAIDLASDITGTLSVGNGGTGATTTALARSNLGLAIGANVQAFDSDTSLLGQTIETSEITNGTILGADLNLTDITLADFTNDQSFITDGNSNWDNSYGFLTDANDTVSGSELDGVFSATGLLTRTGVGAYGTLTDNSANWNTAFGWGDHATEGYLTAITGQSIKTLSDVHSSMTPSDGQVLTYDTTNGWQAETVSSGADDLGNHIATQTLNLNGNYLSGDGGTEGLFVDVSGSVGIGTSNPLGILSIVGDITSDTPNVMTTTAGVTQGERSGYSFFSTFVGTGDNGQRRSADITSGFTGAWGTEYLTFNVGNGGVSNDQHELTSEKMRITSEGNLVFGNAVKHIVPDNTVNVWSIATSTSAAPLFKVDTNAGNELVTLGKSGGSVIIGDVGSATNLVFEESAIIHGQGDNTLTFGQAGDKINFAVNVGIGAATPAYPLHMGSGAFVSTGGSWTNASSRDLKENFISLNSMDILTSINALEISQWNYKAEDASILHIGPIAQDFFAEFGLGGSDVSISTIDTAGVALIGIQALSQKFDDLFAGVSIAEDGTLVVSNIETDNLKTKNFCIGSTCIAEDVLRDLLDLEPLSEDSNVENNPADIIDQEEETSSEDNVVDRTDSIEEITQEGEAEPLAATATSTTPLLAEPDPIEQASSTIEQNIEQPSLDVSEQSSDTSPDDVPVEPSEENPVEPLPEGLSHNEESEIIEQTEPDIGAETIAEQAAEQVQE